MLLVCQPACPLPLPTLLPSSLGAFAMQHACVFVRFIFCSFLPPFWAVSLGTQGNNYKIYEHGNGRGLIIVNWWRSGRGERCSAGCCSHKTQVVCQSMFSLLLLLLLLPALLLSLFACCGSAARQPWGRQGVKVQARGTCKCCEHVDRFWASKSGNRALI